MAECMASKQPLGEYRSDSLGRRRGANAGELRLLHDAGDKTSAGEPAMSASFPVGCLSAG